MLGSPPPLTPQNQSPNWRKATQVFIPNRDSSPKTHILSLPVQVLQRILSHLLVSPSPLLLHRDASTPSTYCTSLTTNIILVNHQLYHTSLPLLYGSNTFTTSSPATSHDFDAHLARVPGRNKCLIRNIALEIDWGCHIEEGGKYGKAGD